jgi:hypothetical protein
MKQYKGYYIDHVYFHSEADIDARIKQQAVEKFAQLNRYFARHSTMEACILCSEQADRLHNIFGFSWEEIEAMEIAAVA